MNIFFPVLSTARASGWVQGSGQPLRLDSIFCTNVQIMWRMWWTRKSGDQVSVSEVPFVREFADVFPEELPGVPPERQVEFRIDLVPGAALIAKALYRLAPPKM